MRAFVASDDPAASYQLREALAKLGQDCPASHVISLDGALSRLASTSAQADTAGPDAVFVILPPNADRATHVIHELRRKTRNRLFAVGPATDPQLLLRTLREGAHEYLDQGNLADDLAAALQRVSLETAGGQTTARVTVIAGASGGCGCSTLATNIAVSHAAAAGTCMLVDLQSEAGDLAPLLDLKPVYSLADLCRSGNRLDRGLVEGALVGHASGVKLLAAPARIEEVSQVTSEGVRRTLALAVEICPYIVIDVGRCLRPEAIHVASQADDVLIVLRLDFTSLRNARRLLEHLQENGTDPGRVKLVVNRHRQPGELQVSEAESALGLKIAKFVLDDPKTVNRANNNGVPVLSHARSAKVSGHISDLASSLRLPPKA